MCDNLGVRAESLLLQPARYLLYISVMPAAPDGSIWHPGRGNSLSFVSFFLVFFSWSFHCLSLFHFSKLVVVWLQTARVYRGCIKLNREEWMFFAQYIFEPEAKAVKHVVRFISWINVVLSCIALSMLPAWRSQRPCRNEPHCFFFPVDCIYWNSYLPLVYALKDGDLLMLYMIEERTIMWKELS